MSEGIQLSEEMINKVVNVIGEYEANARQDPIVVLQYLAAINGYLAAGYPGSDTERDDLLKHLSEFTQHVCNERAQSQQQAPAPQSAAQADLSKGKSRPTDDPAVGIWQPE